MKKYLIITIIVALLFAVTNPTQSDFEHYVELKSGNKVLFDNWYVCARTNYFLVFSIYKYNNLGMDEQVTYVGVFKNFIEVDKQQKERVSKKITSNESLPLLDDSFVEKTYRNLKTAYGDDYSLTLEEFKSKLSDPKFVSDTYYNLKTAYGDDFTISEKDFASSFKRKVADEAAKRVPDEDLPNDLPLPQGATKK